jgi:hypothetical protein
MEAPVKKRMKVLHYELLLRKTTRAFTLVFVNLDTLEKIAR